MISLAMERHFIPKGFIEFVMPGSDALILFLKKGSIGEKLAKAIHSRNISNRIKIFVDHIHNKSKSIPAPREKWYTVLDEKIIIRNRNKLVKNCLRITVGSPDENLKLINALKKISHEKGIVYR